MPRTREELDQAAADAERWLDEMDPTELDDPAADSTSLRRVGFALDAVTSSENELAEAVRLARVDGRSWNDIAAVLGISRQATQKRYGRPRITGS
jgi:DNA-directed RNA polymerase specialized sigma24 family protein